MATLKSYKQFSHSIIYLVNITTYGSESFNDLDVLIQNLFDKYEKKDPHFDINRLKAKIRYLYENQKPILILDYDITLNVTKAIKFLKNNCVERERWRFISNPSVKKHTYQVSSVGRVRVIPHRTNSGYSNSIRILNNKFTMNWKQPRSPLFRKFRVDKLVMRAFHYNHKPGRKYVKHDDGHISNDKYGNLTWVKKPPHQGPGAIWIELRTRKPKIKSQNKFNTKDSFQLKDDTSALRDKISELTSSDLVKRVNDYDSINNRNDRRVIHTSRYVRNPYVRELTLRINHDQRCQLCGKRTFLQNNGRYYFESHHIVPLSEHGVDAVTNTVALCPTCHRKMHLADSNHYDLAKLRKRLKINEMRLIVQYNLQHSNQPILINPISLKLYVSASIWCLVHNFNDNNVHNNS